MKTKYFGTDGIRGKVNAFLTPSISYKLGLSLASFYLQKLEEKLNNKENEYGEIEELENSKTVFIGADPRKTCDLIVAAIASGLMAGGVSVVYGDILPSGGVSFITNKYKFACGVMVTASHNDASYNGIKVFDGSGRKLTVKEEAAIEKLMDSKLELAKSEVVGSFSKNDKLKKEYIKFLKNKFSYRFYNKRIVIGAGFGAGAKIVKEVFGQEQFINVNNLACEENGDMINSVASSVNASEIAKMVVETKSDFGFALDGDADRVVLILSNGKILTGDELIYLLAENLKLSRELKNDIVVATVVSNTGLEIALRRKKIKLIKTEPGDKCVSEKLLELDASLGGEISGHIIFPSDLKTGDGILNIIKILNIFEVVEPSEISQSLSKIKLFDYVEKKVEVSEHYKAVFNSNKKLKEAMYQAESIMATTGRVLVRNSGTKPVIRVIVEGTNSQLNEKVALSLEKFIKEDS